MSKSECELATMDKCDYVVILERIQWSKVFKKVQVLSQFPLFQQWSFREMKTVSYHFEEV